MSSSSSSSAAAAVAIRSAQPSSTMLTRHHVHQLCLTDGNSG
jgi:hypothetical protein